MNIIFFFLQEFPFQNLKHINLCKCESITKLPNLCTPNLENFDLSFCKNLVECHESIGFLDKLKKLRLFSCKKLQNLPSHLTWKSLDTLDISSCLSLDFLLSYSLNGVSPSLLTSPGFMVYVAIAVKMLWILKRSSINYHRLRYYVYILANQDPGVNIVF